MDCRPRFRVADVPFMLSVMLPAEGALLEVTRSGSRVPVLSPRSATIVPVPASTLCEAKSLSRLLCQRLSLAGASGLLRSFPGAPYPAR